MSFASVLKSLQELFPQIDHRMLKAVAIEHTDDFSAAVGFILSEVLPNHPTDDTDDAHLSVCSPDPPYPTAEYQDVGCLSSGPIQIEEQRQFLHHQNTSEEKSAGSSESRLGVSEHGDDFNRNGEIPDDSLTCLVEKLAGTSIPNCHNPVQLSENTETEELGSPGQHEENIYLRSHQCLHAVSSSAMQDNIVLFECNNDARTTIHDLNEPADYDTNLFASSDSSRAAILNEMDVLTQLDLTYVPKETQELVDSVSENEITSISGSRNLETRSSLSGSRNLETRGSSETGSEIGPEQTVDDHEVADLEDGSSSTTAVAQSDQICRINVLEDAISEAKNNKRTLFSSMESVFSMMREVENLETAAEQAKEEAVRGGLDILAKVDEIRKMLMHAKEANDMRTGEVYGEKAILATEARELQARLLNMSYERDRSLAMLNEMRQVLETRMASAEEVRNAAVHDKLEKEQSALKALMEQELIMEKGVQEYNRLQSEAEENSKLQEFLMDRGQVVDILQGELAVICKDVKSLKENFDDKVPFNKSLSSSQTSCILASSGSSGKSLESNLVPEQFESLEGLKMMSTAPVYESSKSTSEGTEGGVSKMLMDDDWDLFEDEVELYKSHN